MCFNANRRLLKAIFVHLLACYLNSLQNARYNYEDHQPLLAGQSTPLYECLLNSIISYILNMCVQKSRDLLFTDMKPKKWVTLPTP